MDLKEYYGHIILHLIDVCARLSAATIIPNKNRDTVIKAIFRAWIAVYGSPDKILIDNGGERANKDVIEMYDYLATNMKTTAAESPWSNGVVERNNQIRANMMDNIISDTNCSLELALTWALNAKNSLQNVAGFSPFQLALGKIQNFHVLSDELPALTMKPTSQAIQENLTAIHNAQSAFIASENDERIKQALAHNTRITSEVKYLTGDKVLYKRDNPNQWQGPGTVIGQVNQQVFIKYGSFHICIHLCRMYLIKPALQTRDSPSSQTNEPDQTENPTSGDIHPSAMPQNVDYSSSLEDEASRDWPQPQTETPSNSSTQHYPQQHHQRQQDCIVPPSSADSPLLSTHCKVTPNTNIIFKVNMEDS